MNESAIYHQSESPFATPLGKGMFLFRLRLGIEDKGDKVLVHFGNKYLFPKRRNTVEAKPLYETRNFVYFEAVCELDDPRLAYVFEIKEGGESLFLSERGLSKGYDFERSYEDFFQYPYVHEGAVPRLPEWTQNAVFYQIFPDRFFRGERGKDDSYINLKWGEKPKAKSFAGGDLKGIKEKLPYLSELGVNALYLTPIFLSPSYHKYDIVDYLKIDPQLGSEEDLKELIAAAHARDIKIVLDAVFNHISAESPFFKDVVEKGKSSPYAGWFYLGKGKPDVEKGNYLYFSCCPYMPKLRTSNPACARYLIDVAIHYLDLGIDGWRLDVADEVSHSFWKKMRAEIKKKHPEAILIGEHWHDPHAFLEGDEFDGTMNYPVTYAIVDFLAKGKIGAKEASSRLNEIFLRTNPTLSRAMLNLLDSHDTFRFRTLAGGNADALVSAFATLVFFPGMSCLYYGTEIGMEGGYDPDSRRCMDWETAKSKTACKTLIEKLIFLRKGEVLSNGSFSAKEEKGLLRIDRLYKGRGLTLLVNGSKKPVNVIAGEEVLSSNLEMGTLNPHGFLIRRYQP